MRRRPIAVMTITFLACLVLLLIVFPSWGDYVFGFSRTEETIRGWMEESPGIYVRVRSIETGEGRTRIGARLYDPDGRLTGWDLLVRMYTGDPGFEEGDILYLTGRVTWPEGPRNPGQWDAENYMRTRGWRFEIVPEKIQVIGHAGPSPSSLIGRARRYLSRTIDLSFEAPVSGLVKAMLLGEKSSLDSETKDLMSRAGISHVAAISGLHLTILVGGFGRWLKDRLGSRRSFPLLMIVLWAYVWLTGFSTATLRAAVMMTYQSAAPLIDGDTDEISSLCTAAIVQLIIQPCCILGAAFWLSYTAVIGLWIGRSFALQISILPRPLRDRISGGLGVSLLTLPVSMIFFSSASIGTFFLNLLVVPLVTYLLILSLLALVLSLLWSLPGSFMVFLVTSFFRLVLWVSRYSSELPWLSLYGRPEVFRIAVFFGIVGGLLLAWKRPAGKRTGWYVSVLVLTVFLLLSPGSKRVMFLDVGQGDCSVIEWDGTVIVVDAGPSYQKVIAPYMQSRGIRHIDLLVLSHPDMDHMEGMLELARSDMVIDILMESPALSNDTPERRELEEMVEAKGGTVIRAHAGQIFHLGRKDSGIYIEALSPVMEYGNTNDDSLVVLVRLNESLQVLYTGDIGVEADQLLETGSIRQDVPLILKAAHHGSMYSTSEALLDRTGPELAIVSAGVDNGYGHPHEAFLERLIQRGIPFEVTAWNGAIWAEERFGTIKYRHMIEVTR